MVQRLILSDVSWYGYSCLLREVEGRRLRFTYDRGRLEIMERSYENENTSQFLGRIVITLSEELSLPIRGGGSTTFRRKKEKKGLESDNCYWIANELAVRNLKVINLRKDP